MSLPARQRRALGRIEKALLAGDPRFRALFTVFTRLTWREAMPGTEVVKPGRWRLLRPLASAIAIAMAAAAAALMLSVIAPSQPWCAAAAAPRYSHSSGHPPGCTPRPVLPQDRGYLR